MFSNKFSRNEKINLTEENEIISADNELSRVFSNFFLKAVEELKILSISNFMHSESNDSLKEAFSYFENYPSIVNIKRKGYDTSFTFRETNSNEAIKLFKTFSINKSSQIQIFLQRSLNQMLISSYYIFTNSNYFLQKAEFPCVFKHGDLYLCIRIKASEYPPQYF